MRSIMVLAGVTLFAGVSHANEFYTQVAGRNRPVEEVKRDTFGNAEGNEYDLGRDGAFRGEKIAVLQLYAGEDEAAFHHIYQGLHLGGVPGIAPFDFELPRKALAEKGFELIHWKGAGALPTPENLRAALRQASQLWVISGRVPYLTPAHHDVIKEFFDRGRGLYIWGDNDPYYVDANALTTRLFETTMAGNVPGNQVVQPRAGHGGPGFIQDHLLTTGIEHLYEGVTIATLKETSSLKPLLYGSANNLVAAFYDRGGKRAILDGGFTRLYCNWDTAGSARYVKNAAVWLANVEGRRPATPWYTRRAGTQARQREVVREPVREPVRERSEGVPRGVLGARYVGR